ncbi:hypothetical protein EJ02DRAFT_191622 [Clathrospora elynae]|uniref:Uncharacterized protein n=1 Tax=Clathrospora elynae TaxID=706981 RepID=A0A6A5SM75_9PLEO|nr:hypothetical protein EJ02DRAFT_191622 [Clathrospora elynae]
MSPQQTPVQLERLRERITAIKQNTSYLAAKLTDSFGKKSLGRKGDSARRKIAESLRAQFPAHQANSSDADNSGNGMQYDSPGSFDNETRAIESAGSKAKSDSMDPMVREGVGERESWRGEYSLNSARMRKLKLAELEEKYIKGGKFATVGRAQGKELSSILQSSFADPLDDDVEQQQQQMITPGPSPSPNPSLTTTNPYASPSPVQEEEGETVYETSAKSGTTQPPTNPSPQISNPHSNWSSIHPITPSPTFSTFPIYNGAPISPIQPFDPSTFDPKDYTRPEGEHSREWFDRDIGSARHPFYGTTPEQRRRWWDGLSGYTRSSSGFTRGSPMPLRQEVEPMSLGGGDEGRESLDEPMQYHDRLLGSASQSCESVGGEVEPVSLGGGEGRGSGSGSEVEPVQYHGRMLGSASQSYKRVENEASPVSLNDVNGKGMSRGEASPVQYHDRLLRSASRSCERVESEEDIQQRYLEIRN